MPRQTPQSSTLSLQDTGGCPAQPLPADEQLALLFHLADNSAMPATPPEPEHPSQHPSQPQPALTLQDAYKTCERITRNHSKSFYFSTSFLPPDKRQAIRSLYAFCRTSDDAVDMATTDPAQALAAWVHQTRSPTPPPDNPVLLAWNDTRTHYQLSPVLIDELLAGVAMDLTICNYATFADLWLYCYRVASVVGLLSIGILGKSPGADPYAIKLGVALQMTNILRDVGEDARRGRVYLPEEDLRQFGLTPDDILNASEPDDRFRALMQFEIDRAKRLYEESWKGIALLPSDCHFAVGVAAWVYRGILDKIVLNDYDSFRKRAHLTFAEKLKMMPHIWHSIRQLRHKKQRKK